MQMPGMMVRRATKAGWRTTGLEMTRSEELNPWMVAQRKGSNCQARQEDDQCKRIVQNVTQKSTDFLRTDHRVSQREGRGHTGAQ